jgi:DnaJ-domain-containing protein 1
MRLSDARFGPSQKRLADLSEEELLQERERRRRKQASDEPQPTWTRVKQYLANLELAPGATWPEVERAYKRLIERYHPDKHQTDPDRHRVAQELSDSLTSAYQALRRYFGAE